MGWVASILHITMNEGVCLAAEMEEWAYKTVEQSILTSGRQIFIEYRMALAAKVKW